MRTFVIKDLMINVLDLQGVAAGCNGSGTQQDPECSGICPGSKDPLLELGPGIKLETNPAVLVALRNELEKQLQSVVKRQQVLAKELRPRKAADVALVRQQLTQALAELDSEVSGKK